MQAAACQSEYMDCASSPLPPPSTTSLDQSGCTINQPCTFAAARGVTNWQAPLTKPRSEHRNLGLRVEKEAMENERRVAKCGTMLDYGRLLRVLRPLFVRPYGGRMSFQFHSPTASPLAIDPISMRIPDACRFTGLSRSTLYLLIARGEVEVVKVGSATLVLTDSLRALVERQRGGQPNRSATKIRRASD